MLCDLQHVHVVFPFINDAVSKQQLVSAAAMPCLRFPLHVVVIVPRLIVLVICEFFLSEPRLIVQVWIVTEPSERAGNVMRWSTAQPEESRTVNSRVARVLHVDRLAYGSHAFALIQPPKAVGAALLWSVVHSNFKWNG